MAELLLATGRLAAKAMPARRGHPSGGFERVTFAAGESHAPAGRPWHSLKHTGRASRARPCCCPTSELVPGPGAARGRGACCAVLASTLRASVLACEPPSKAAATRPCNRCGSPPARETASTLKAATRPFSRSICSVSEEAEAALSSASAAFCWVISSMWATAWLISSMPLACSPEAAEISRHGGR